MQKQHQYYVYIMASKSGVLYIGVTNDLRRRVIEHKENLIEGFTKHYYCHTLVYAEQFQWIQEAIARETQLKKWNREKKKALIARINPEWNDLSVE